MHRLWPEVWNDIRRAWPFSLIWCVLVIGAVWGQVSPPWGHIWDLEMMFWVFLPWMGIATVLVIVGRIVRAPAQEISPRRLLLQKLIAVMLLIMGPPIVGETGLLLSHRMPPPVIARVWFDIGMCRAIPLAWFVVARLTRGWTRRAAYGASLVFVCLPWWFPWPGAEATAADTRIAILPLQIGASYDDGPRRLVVGHVDPYWCVVSVEVAGPRFLVTGPHEPSIGFEFLDTRTGASIEAPPLRTHGRLAPSVWGVRGTYRTRQFRLRVGGDRSPDDAAPMCEHARLVVIRTMPSSLLHTQLY